MKRSYAIAAFIIVLSSLAACKRQDMSDMLDGYRRADTLTWVNGQNAYKTNHLPGAYTALLQSRSDLEQIKAKGRRNLNYAWCDAVLNGQLFVMAERLGKTNEAEKFYRESARGWVENSIGSRLPAKNYTQAEIRRLIEVHDAHAGPVLWRQEDKNTGVK